MLVVRTAGVVPVTCPHVVMAYSLEIPVARLLRDHPNLSCVLNTILQFLPAVGNASRFNLSDYHVLSVDVWDEEMEDDVVALLYKWWRYEPYWRVVDSSLSPLYDRWITDFDLRMNVVHHSNNLQMWFCRVGLAATAGPHRVSDTRRQRCALRRDRDGRTDENNDFISNLKLQF